MIRRWLRAWLAAAFLPAPRDFEEELGTHAQDRSCD